MTEQARQGVPDVLIVHHPNVAPEVLAAIGKVARAAGHSIGYRSAAGPRSETAEVGETLPPVYASLSDFKQAAVQLNTKEAIGAAAWRVLAREYGQAYRASETSVLQFSHPLVEPRSELSLDNLRAIDVRSLAAYIHPFNTRIARTSGWRAKELIDQLLPYSAGERALAVWNTVVKNKLPPTQEV